MKKKIKLDSDGRVRIDNQVMSLLKAIPQGNYYKEKIINLLDVVDKNAKEIGAVNTIKIKKGKLIGYNTDYIGFLKTIDGFNFTKAAIFGSGGASIAIAFALRTKKIPYVIFSRKLSLVRMEKYNSLMHYLI